MPLQFPNEWHFEGCGISIPKSVHTQFRDLISRIAASGKMDSKWVYETVKSAFGSDYSSSSTSFAESDMNSAMANSMENAAIYISSFWQARENCERAGLPVPSVERINKILREEQVPLKIDPPNLQRIDIDAVVSDIAAVEPTAGPANFTRCGVLGNGGFGTVYHVQKTTSMAKFDFAMKVFDPNPYAKNPERALERFHREVQILSKLQHRGIISHLEAGVGSDHKPFILMPLINGHTLYDLSNSRPSKILDTFTQILDALAYAHANDVIHRDLKPENIMIRSSDGQPIILDFGCAYLLDDLDQKALTTQFVGTSRYAPPEVLRNPLLRTPQQDIYAIGVLLYQILLKELPDYDEYAPIEDEFKGLVGIDDIVRQALAPARKRIATAVEFRDRLKEL